AFKTPMRAGRLACCASAGAPMRQIVSANATETLLIMVALPLINARLLLGRRSPAVPRPPPAATADLRPRTSRPRSLRLAARAPRRDECRRTRAARGAG